MGKKEDAPHTLVQVKMPHHLVQNITASAAKRTTDAVAPVKTDFQPHPVALQQNETVDSITRKTDAGAPVKITWQGHPNLA